MFRSAIRLIPEARSPCALTASFLDWPLHHGRGLRFENRCKCAQHAHSIVRSPLFLQNAVVIFPEAETNMKLPDTNRDRFFELETALHRKEIRNSAESVSQLLADEFKEFGSSGRIFSKASIIESLKKTESDQPLLVDNFDVQKLAQGVVLVTYFATNSAGTTWTLR